MRWGKVVLETFLFLLVLKTAGSINERRVSSSRVLFCEQGKRGSVNPQPRCAERSCERRTIYIYEYIYIIYIYIYIYI